MLEKYVVRDGDIVVAIKYDVKQSLVIIGGFAQFREFMEKIIKEYFNTKIHFSEYKWTQANKIRFSFALIKKRFDAGIEKLKEHGFDVEQVRTLERIMR